MGDLACASARGRESRQLAARSILAFSVELTLSTYNLPFPVMASAMTMINASAAPSAPTAEWWTGEQVREHLSHCSAPEAALHKLSHDVGAGRAQARVSSASDPRNGGRPQVHPHPPEVEGDIWWRIVELAPATDIWAEPILSLPRTGNEKAIDLVGLSFSAADVRTIANDHGFVPPAALKPKNRGGINCRAHGVVIAKVTLDLIARGPEKVSGLTGVSLQKEVQALYKRIDQRGLSQQNVGRVANGILEVVHQHFSEGSVHSIHD